ncbi:MAG: hypothetical protein GY810_03615 [Aureispira sp.]|nr:hypothetical protein [Aureispira sp.]
MKLNESPRIIWAISLSVAVFFGMSSFMFDASWDLQKDENGVQVYTRSIEGWDINEYKATAKVKASLDRAVEAYRCGHCRSQWATKRTSEVKNLKEVTHDRVYTYSYADAPWPIADRDNVALVEYFYPKKGTVVAKMSAAPDYMPRKSGVVRVERIKGSWTFVDLGNGYTQVTTQVVADPGGSLPTWLVNANIVNGPHESVSGLKKYLEK